MTHSPKGIRRLAAAILLGVVATATAEIEVAPLERSEPVGFTRDIAPLLKRSCVACHNETKAKADLNLETVEAILKGSGDGPVVVPGKADDSFLFIVSAHRDDPVMPPEKNKANAPNLTPAELALLKRWIDEGAKGDDEAAAGQRVEFATMSDRIDAIYSVAISPDNLYAAAGRGNRIHLYHLPTGQKLAELSDPALADKGGAAHLDIVGALAFGGDGLLASGGFRTVKLWRRAENPLSAEMAALAADPSASAVGAQWAVVGDATGGIALYSLVDPALAPKTFKDHAAAITGAGFTADGKLVTVSLDKTVKWRPAGGDGAVTQIAELPSPIHSMALIDDGKRIACGCEDGVVRLVPFEGEIAELKAHGSKVSALAAAGKTLISAGADSKLVGWNLSQLEKPAFEANNGAAVLDLALARDDARFATVGEDKTVRLWNGADFKRIAEFKTDAEALRAQARAERALAVANRTRDSRKKSLDEAMKKVGEEKAKAKAAAEAETKALAEYETKLTALAAAEAAKRRTEGAPKPAENLVKAATDAVNKALKESDDAKRKRIEATRNAELAVRFSSRAAETAAAADAALAAAEAVAVAATTALEAAKTASAGTAKALKQIAFTADGGLLLASAEDGRLYSWAADTGAAAGSVLAGVAMASLEPLADGRVLGAGANKSVAIYETVPRWTIERTIGSHDDAETFADRLNAVAFSADGRTLATGGGVPSRGGELKVWRVRDGTMIAENVDDHSDAISAVAFSPDGQHVATAATDRFVKIFTAEEARLERSLEGHTNHVLDVAWRADGLALASSGADNVVKVWDFEAGTQKQTVKGHSKPVTSVAFVGSGETLVSSSGDKSVRLGNQPLPDAGTFMHAAEASSDGKMIAAGGEDSVLRIWNTGDKKVLLKLQ